MVVIVMGVSGAGKTTIGARLAALIGGTLEEGDSYHPAANIEKMRRGEALNDADRAPWLDAIATRIEAHLAAGKNAVVTCSALKESYREILTRGGDGIYIVYLRGSEALVAARHAARQHHFMPTSLLRSQFATLEEPQEAANLMVVDIADSPDQIVTQIEGKLAAIAA